MKGLLSTALTPFILILTLYNLFCQSIIKSEHLLTCSHCMGVINRDVGKISVQTLSVPMFLLSIKYENVLTLIE